MRIDGNRAHSDAAIAQNQKVNRTADETGRSASTARTGTTDRVAVSADAALANAAVKAASETPEIRSELVERMRRLLDAGTLGVDSVGLANTLIDSMLEQQ